MNFIAPYFMGFGLLWLWQRRTQRARRCAEDAEKCLWGGDAQVLIEG